MRWCLFGLYATEILVLSLLPASALPESTLWFSHEDKAVHAVMYGAFALIFVWAAGGFGNAWRAGYWRWAAAATTSAAVYGALMEWLQAVVLCAQGRSFSGGDMLANVLGAAVAVAVARGLVRVGRRLPGRGCV